MNIHIFKCDMNLVERIDIDVDIRPPGKVKRHAVPCLPLVLVVGERQGAGVIGMERGKAVGPKEIHGHSVTTENDELRRHAGNAFLILPAKVRLHVVHSKHGKVQIEARSLIGGHLPLPDIGTAPGRPDEREHHKFVAVRQGRPISPTAHDMFRGRGKAGCQKVVHRA